MDKALYTRPNKPNWMPVRRRRTEQPMVALEVPEVMAVDASTECHVTPQAVADRMVSYLCPDSQSLILEPHAGTGNLILSLLDVGCDIGKIVAVERHQGLCQAIEERFEGLPLVCGCFLEYAEEMAGKRGFSHILMNPPFKHVKKHMKAALSLLDSSIEGRASLVALVPVTYEHEDAHTCEVLGNDTFPNAKVLTKIIQFEY